MSYRVEIDRSALRALAKLDKPVRRRIQAAIDQLAEQPRPPGCVKLSGRDNQWRIRAARDWRIVYEIHDHQLLVLVIDLGHRSSIYR